ncbi:MAG: glycogen debranching protein GlgX [Nitrospinales bacterium]
MKLEGGGQPSLGSHWDGEGVYFSIFSENATKVELCLFDSVQSKTEYSRISLCKGENNVWSSYIKGATTGTLYGYRIYGPNEPSHGHRFNPSKILVDPYAKSLGRPLQWTTDISYPNYKFDNTDNAAHAPLCKVIDTSFSWGDDCPPSIPWDDTIIYEAHVKGMTKLHPEVPDELKGSYGGFATEPVIKHLKGLGVTAVEFLPIHQKVDEYHLFEKGMTNYWGYSPLLFFTPELGYAVNDPVKEFKEMVRSLHREGIEVILDMVFNHTPEGDQYGPTFSFRGIDNKTYYKLDHDDNENYIDFTGCGNTLNTANPTYLKLVLDCLRYWVQEMHVDGFRFDLASSLIRVENGFEGTSNFLEHIKNDSILKNVKLIAEPWDLGKDGYKLSEFPAPWSEWNDQYRQVVRQFWRGDKNKTGLFARRISGSGDIFQPKKRLPCSSINYITCHDGFTLSDLVSFQKKNNLNNNEDNRDGIDDNFSCNYGTEGATIDAQINFLRQKQKRNLFATLMISLGTPMISGGDELGWTQRGNNNAYCQDNDISWLNWELDEDQKYFLNFTTQIIQIRKNYPILRQNFYFEGIAEKEGTKDIIWLSPHGRELNSDDWGNDSLGAFGFLLNQKISSKTPDSLLILINPEDKEIPFSLTEMTKNYWEVLLDTNQTKKKQMPKQMEFKDFFLLPNNSLMIFRKLT